MITSLRAQRSNPSPQRKNGLLRRFAPRKKVAQKRCHTTNIEPQTFIQGGSVPYPPVPSRNDGKHAFATPRREAPGSCKKFSAPRGRGECRMPVAPAASCALVVVERTRVTTSTPESPGIPARNGFNGFLRALPGDRALLPPSPHGYPAHSNPVGRLHLRKT